MKKPTQKAADMYFAYTGCEHETLIKINRSSYPNDLAYLHDVHELFEAGVNAAGVGVVPEHIIETLRRSAHEMRISLHIGRLSREGFSWVYLGDPGRAPAFLRAAAATPAQRCFMTPGLDVSATPLEVHITW